ncbi:MAG TPA: CDGSH iron-sulfur domain-containing protein [Burkholderiales bacterium]|jgi:CDGSH-type Zn-finger protein|nr:CDGSH iron-sulfur domain-containing protein [Burkholderiales bacterium]
MADVKITARKNGPYRVEGVVELYYDDQKVEIPDGPYFSLCRCGASSKKPFCDGTHSKIGFQAAAEKVPESKE